MQAATLEASISLVPSASEQQVNPRAREGSESSDEKWVDTIIEDFIAGMIKTRW